MTDEPYTVLRSEQWCGTCYPRPTAQPVSVIRLRCNECGTEWRRDNAHTLWHQHGRVPFSWWGVVLPGVLVLALSALAALTW